VKVLSASHIARQPKPSCIFPAHLLTEFAILARPCQQSNE
jgi:hypothetical protein